MYECEVRSTKLTVFVAGWSKCVPVNEAEVFLQVVQVHMALAQLQLCAWVVMHIVHTHLLHDPKPTRKTINTHMDFPRTTMFIHLNS